MPNYHFPIPDLEATVERQVALSVVKQMCSNMDMREEPIVVFNGQHNERPTSGSQDQDNINRNELNGYTSVFITYDEEEHEDVVANSFGYYRPNDILLFSDPDINVRLFANYVRTIGRIQFRYQGVDRNRASQFNNYMRSKYFSLKQTWLFEPEYNFFIPNELTYCLVVANKMKNAALKTDVRDSEYLRKHLISAIKVKRRADGEPDKLYKKEIQSGVFGDLSPETKVLLEKEGENSKVTLTYTLEFVYSKPTVVRLYMPNFIGQQTIPKELRKFNLPYDPERKPNKNKISSYSDYLFRNISQLNTNDEWMNTAMLRYPNWDEFDDPQVKDYMVPIASFYCPIRNNNRTIITMDFIQKCFKVHPSIIRYMEECGGDMLSPSKCGILLSVYFNDTRMSGEIFHWDSDCNAIVANDDLDRLIIYRVVLSLNRSMSNSSFDVNTFLEHGEAARLIIDRVFPNKDIYHEIELDAEKGTMTYTQLDDILTRNSCGFDQIQRDTVSTISVGAKQRGG
jgi:hypothetical protein